MKNKTYYNKLTIEKNYFDTDMSFAEILLYSYIRTYNLANLEPLTHKTRVIGIFFNKSSGYLDATLNKLIEKGWVLNKNRKLGDRSLIVIELSTFKPIISIKN